MKTILVFDIGSNSVIATLVSQNANKIKIYLDESKVLGLVDGIKDGILQSYKVAELLSVVSELKTRALNILNKNKLSLDGEYYFGTEALRRIKNIDILSKTLHGLSVITGKEEAELAYNATNIVYKQDLLVDLGGASTEIVFRISGNLKFYSIPIGARTCTKGLAVLDSVLQNVASINGVGVITGGTASALVAGKLGLDTFKHNKTEGISISYREIDSYYLRFREDGTALKDFLKFDPGREESFLCGLKIILYILSSLHIDNMIVSNFGARFGYIYQKLGIENVSDIVWI